MPQGVLICVEVAAAGSLPFALSLVAESAPFGEGKPANRSKQETTLCMTLRISAN
jgi:hypothetical protein